MEQQTLNLSSEIDVRRAKIDQLEKNGEIVYKAKFDCSCKISDVWSSNTFNVVFKLQHIAICFSSDTN